MPASTSPESGSRPPLRRFRVARLRFDTPEMPAPRRYEYLKRTFD